MATRAYGNNLPIILVNICCWFQPKASCKSWMLSYFLMASAQRFSQKGDALYIFANGFSQKIAHKFFVDGLIPEGGCLIHFRSCYEVPSAWPHGLMGS